LAREEGKPDIGSETGSAPDRLAKLLGIPDSLRTRPPQIDIRLAWQKWLAYNNAMARKPQLVSEGVWEVALQKATDLQEVFVSKSVWFKDYKALFQHVDLVPGLVAWLNCEEDAPSGAHFFVQEKLKYTFNDLRRLLNEPRDDDDEPQGGGDDDNDNDNDDNETSDVSMEDRQQKGKSKGKGKNRKPDSDSDDNRGKKKAKKVKTASFSKKLANK
jgi:hypothetical protein